MKRKGGIVMLALFVASASGAAEAADKAEDKQFTLGLVQQRLRVGMSQTELAAESFRIDRTEPELGLIVAVKDSFSRRGVAKRLLNGYLNMASYGLLRSQSVRHSILEAAAQVSESEGKLRVGVGLQLRELDKDGRVVRAQTVDDGAAYQALFARLDKSLFLRREGL